MLKFKKDGRISTIGLFKPDTDVDLEELGIDKRTRIEDRDPEPLTFYFWDLASYNRVTKDTTNISLRTGESFVLNVDYNSFDKFLDEIDDEQRENTKITKE